MVNYSRLLADVKRFIFTFNILQPPIGAMLEFRKLPEALKTIFFVI
nr:MAG TPA: hypothetical protein [Caudoviricetes sp.]